MIKQYITCKLFFLSCVAVHHQTPLDAFRSLFWTNNSSSVPDPQWLVGRPVKCGIQLPLQWTKYGDTKTTIGI